MTRLPVFKALSFYLFLFVLLNSNCTRNSYPKGLFAELHTNRGLIVLKLEFERVPMTTANFVGLSEGTIKNAALSEGIPFYQRSTFHRVVPGHVIQSGSPRIKGITNTGYTFPNEIHPELSHNKPGVLGMANRGPHTNSSQFYITLADRSYLDGDYTVFGEVYSGMDVVNSIARGDVIQEIKIIRNGKKAKNFRPDTEFFEEHVEISWETIRKAEKVKRQHEKEYIKRNWPDAVETENGIMYSPIREGKGRLPRSGDEIFLSYSGSVLDGPPFASTESGVPGTSFPPKEFTYMVGTNHITPGLDRIIPKMKAGEKRIVIIPSSLAYGKAGYYAPEKSGKKRFVISPDSTLVYEVEVHEIIDR